MGSQLYEDLSAIVGSPQSAQEPSFGESVNQFHSAVMLKLHSFRQHTDGRFDAIGKTSNRQQQLVLLRFDARLARGIFAETQEASYLIAQLRHRFEIGLSG